MGLSLDKYLTNAGYEFAAWVSGYEAPHHPRGLPRANAVKRLYARKGGQTSNGKLRPPSKAGR